MKKIIALMLTLCLMLGIGAGMAESVEDRLAAIVKEALDQFEMEYEYDDEKKEFFLGIALESALAYADATIYLYDDMVSVTFDSPLTVPEALFEKMAIFLTLANNEIYYAQFRLDRESGLLTCRSCNVIEDVLPSASEIMTLLATPFEYMDRYGDGIAAICSEGADPYAAFETCQAAYEAAE